jgi:hypothetical protein
MAGIWEDRRHRYKVVAGRYTTGGGSKGDSAVVGGELSSYGPGSQQVSGMIA